MELILTMWGQPPSAVRRAKPGRIGNPGPMRNRPIVVALCLFYLASPPALRATFSPAASPPT